MLNLCRLETAAILRACRFGFLISSLVVTCLHPARPISSLSVSPGLEHLVLETLSDVLHDDRVPYD
jgi:hypothetical protein